jgi:hypothetical protein
VMLRNDAPLAIAVQFGPLSAVHPGHVDLGSAVRRGNRLRPARHRRRVASTWPVQIYRPTTRSRLRQP